ncbi:hypothetical protein HS088_TW13G00361 [Tripterygium wilfordii]|uniref:Apple domain-containing protein n=1 Tax=Tripterygium wilfordii TaxID=458696 RepID=A0A7J7CTS8_TRIWF|nr:PAN domain-containing protein At5g03700 [Tripterygium wilfordii]KAF5737480.1 hypothetical protein HS088_TW13G00361 [Tripterygium wilfordii]
MVTRSSATQFLILAFFVLYGASTCTHTAAQELLKGFRATPNPSVSSFQSLLNDSTGNFSLGFLRINRTQLALAILHVKSSEPLWLANQATLARWHDRTQLIFNGSLVVSDPDEGVFWSTGTQGDRVVLLNTSNLQIRKLDNPLSVLWQSFDFPSNTIVENQNFTANMSLVSSNGMYSMRLGDNFMGLYAKFNEGTDQIYLKHRALQAKQTIIEGIPIYARVNPDGFLGMYQTGNTPVDIEPFMSFNSFQSSDNGFLMVRLEPDGNLKGYNWDGSDWDLNYQAIRDQCELPNPCGSYGLCLPGEGCTCLDNRTDFHSGECFAPQSGNFCEEGEAKNDFWILRRNGVALPFSEWMIYETVSSLDQCETICDGNCSCWGAVYNNASGFCYLVHYPIQSLVGVGDLSKVGYFKVRTIAEKKREVGSGVGFGILGLAILGMIGAIGFGSYRVWSRRRRDSRILEEEGGLSPGPYKDLGSASFRSIEMSNR